MAVQLEANTKRLRGLSMDAKPTTDTPNGSVFTELDTGSRFIWDGTSWDRQEQAIEPLFEAIIFTNQQILAELETIRRGHEEYLWEHEVDPE